VNGFTVDQLKRFANILDNIGQVILATVVLPYLFSAAEDSKAFKPGDECVSFCKEKRRLRALDRSPSFIEKDSVAYSLIGFFVATLSWWLSLRVERITS